MGILSRDIPREGYPVKKKLLAVMAALVPVMVLAPVTRADAADPVCLPITVDGQPVCLDKQPVDDAVAAAVAEAFQVVAIAEGLPSTASSLAQDVRKLATICPRVASDSDGMAVYVPDQVWDDPGTQQLYCAGYKVSVTGVTTEAVPVHFPQICLTTT